MLSVLFDASRTTKRVISLCYDTVAIVFAVYISISLRLGSFVFPIGVNEFIALGLTVVVTLAAFIRLGLYRAILRYMTLPAMMTIVLGVCISGVMLAVASFLTYSKIPRSVPFIYISMLLLFVGTPRLLVRSVIMLISRQQGGNKEPVIIYGAGYTGHQLILGLQATPYKVVAFVDDNPTLHGTVIANVMIYDPALLGELLRNNGAVRVLLALGDTPKSRRAEVIKRLESLHVSVQTAPAISDILRGKARVENIKDVEIEDLLGRDPVQPDPELLHACITGKSVMVSGAGGSIGSELCRQIIRQAPRVLVLYELNEYNLYSIAKEMEMEIACAKADIHLVSLLGSVQDPGRLETVMKTFAIQTVYHAAAYKHVPLVEANIVEGVRNNVFGTLRCAEAAIKTGVESFVLVSTDKAVRPTNIMGASKRMAELLLQSLAQEHVVTRFTIVRFGNVLGSSGSVVPLFRQQIQQGGPVTVTHPDVTRYFMTIPEAAELVIQAGAMGSGGDVFVLDMGEPVRILDLATRMIGLSGCTIKDDKNLDGDIEINYTGLRPGEKLYEELMIGDKVSGTEHSRIMRAEEKSLDWAATHRLLTDLEAACDNYNCILVKELLLKAPTDYQAHFQLEDPVWEHAAEISKPVVTH